MNFKYDIDDRLVIVGNEAGHDYAHGTIVTVTNLDEHAVDGEGRWRPIYYCERECGETWYIFEDDAQPVIPDGPINIEELL